MSNKKEVSIATSLQSTLTLNDGNVMPLYGLGCFYMEEVGEDVVSEAVSHALKIGYRLLDTAQYYRNEKEVGAGLKLSGVPRDNVFITSKIWCSNHGHNECIKAVTDSLKLMDEKYIDLYLIHSPSSGRNIETYKALLEMKSKGYIKSVGVSNFGVAHLEEMKKAGCPLPSVNQIELHPWHKQVELVDYCRKEGIAVEGYCPVVRMQRGKIDHPTLVKIANSKGKKPAQILLRWAVQLGYITIPKAQQPQHIEENARVFDFQLTDEEMALLDNFEEKGITWNPTIAPWLG